MEFMVVRDSESELQHHGTKGMRWGIRRYQNKDGSLTPLGEKRRSLGQTIHDYKVKRTRAKSLAKARAAKEANKKAAEEEAKKAAERAKKLEAGKIPVKKMTDEELKSALTRKQNEVKYKEAVLETSPGKRFVSKMWNDTIVPGMAEGGKKAVSKFAEKTLSDLLGLNTKEAKSAYQTLKEEAEMAKWRKEKFQNERDYTEARKRYNEHLERERNSNQQNNQNQSQRNSNQQNNQNQSQRNSNQQNNQNQSQRNSNRDDVDDLLNDMQNRRVSEVADMIRNNRDDVDDLLNDMQNRRASEVADMIRNDEDDD